MKLKDILYIAVIAAGYAGLTVLIAPIAYGPIQVRISDIFLVLPFNKKFGTKAIWGLTIGTFIANLNSPYNPYDLILGTTASFISALAIYLCGKYIKNRKVGLIAGIAASIVIVDFFIAFLLLNYIFKVPLGISMLGVTIGQIISVGIGGYLLAIGLEKKFPEEGEQQIAESLQSNS
ncbi:QueT transporter family protein [Fervidicoccus fontis]|uniref:QueT transporter family protein n=1 Tax=Fervidicoccus fontis (strain DSM 19380 / JCM 18336 / VKM B-2539 / Kam940) TaxID=1163730 RepID=H9ZZV8_FERFK|nr:QueT transporter family protein [Fervidicoccus fontis]AFH42265.1 hypothetical protein FFONT_0275 [Fervidicoccus fontis Kam940]